MRMSQSGRLAAIIALVWLMALPQCAAAGVVRGLFVGIDIYQNSGPANEFENLDGSVNDATAVRDAIEATYHFGFAQGRPAHCPAAPFGVAVASITLLNECATHDVIVAALRQLIAWSAPGDTVVFFYAGHGAQIQDYGANSKTSGVNDTLLAYDSRAPTDHYYEKEIVDHQLNAIIENALRIQGANVITIFDACNSGTADRDPTQGTGRGAPLVTVNGLRQPIDVVVDAPSSLHAPGHRAHLAAAADGEIAMERAFGGTPPITHGVFSKALIDALPATPGYALADILAAVQAALGKEAQHPTGDGLLMAMNGSMASGILLGAAVAGGTVTLQAGVLGNVTIGSRFALYRNFTDARMAMAMPLAVGQVTAVQDNSAALTLDQPLATAPVGQIVARETSHAPGTGTVNVVMSPALADPAARKAIADALGTLKYVSTASPADVVIAPAVNAPGQIDVLIAARTPAATQTLLAHLPAPADPKFVGALDGAIGPRARVNAMITLANAQGTQALQLCVSATKFNRYPGFVCNALAGGGGLTQDAPAYMAVVNQAAEPRYIYVYGLADDDTVTLLTLQDAPLPQGGVLAIDFVPNLAGTIRFLVLATRQPINSSALEQDGGARDGGTCQTTLEKLLCNANTGARDGETARVDDDWAGIVQTVAIGAPGATPRSTGG